MQLKTLGHAPREARKFATARIFGAPGNRSYGTDIMGMVEKGDTWENAQEVADRYVRNMGGIYRDEKNWGTYLEGLFEAQLQGTEVVVQPRSSNTWGPLSLDHVYEFMGGLTLAVRAKTGVDPTGYFNDLRKPGQARTRTAVATIREEARTTLWNPRFLQGMQREGASAAAALTESVRNMYGWNVMQPAAIGPDMWDETYAVLLQDKHNLQIRDFFEQKNPYALQNMTAIMLETARKGYWKPSEETLRNLAQIHVEVVEQYGAGCSYETCGNQALHKFIEGQLITPGSDVPPPALAAYQATLAGVLQSSVPLPEVEGIAMDEKIKRSDDTATPAHSHATLVLAAALWLGTVSLLVTGYRLPKQ
jgi:cobaltochelatase CobN